MFIHIFFKRFLSRFSYILTPRITDFLFILYLIIVELFAVFFTSNYDLSENQRFSIMISLSFPSSFYHNSDLCLLYYIMINGHFFSHCLYLVLKHLTQAKKVKKRLEKQKLCRKMHGNHSPRPPFWPILTYFYSLLFNYTSLAHF